MCKSCNFIHKSDEGCWKSASGKSLKQLEKASTWPDESEGEHYNYYLVHKQAGTLHGGFEYKQDAVDASKDYHIPAADLKVTHRSKIDPAVKEKFHRDNRVMSKLKKSDELEKAKIIDAKTRKVLADLPSDAPTPKKGALRLADAKQKKKSDDAALEDHMAEILSIGHNPKGREEAKEPLEHPKTGQKSEKEVVKSDDEREEYVPCPYCRGTKRAPEDDGSYSHCSECNHDGWVKESRANEIHLGKSSIVWRAKEKLSEITLKSEDGDKKPLNKPMRGDVKKFKVFVKDPATGNTKKVNFGDKNMEIKRDDPERRKNFRARHSCEDPGPKTKARYWSCKMWSSKPVSEMVKADPNCSCTKCTIAKSELEKRCWDGYEPVPGKKPYSKGSCRPTKKSEDSSKSNDSEELGVVPHSELAMHTKIAGKKIKSFKIKSPHMAEVMVDGSDAPVSGTHGEVLSHEIKSKLDKSELEKARVDEGKTLQEKGAARARRNQRSVKPGTERGPAGGKLRSFMSRIDRAADLRSGAPGQKGEKITGEPRDEKGVHVRSGDYARQARMGGKGPEHSARIVDRNSPKGERDHWRTPHPWGSKDAHLTVIQQQREIKPKLDKSDVIQRVKDKLKK